MHSIERVKDVCNEKEEGRRMYVMKKKKGEVCM
jgi:hypothetical protein